MSSSMFPESIPLPPPQSSPSEALQPEQPEQQLGTINNNISNVSAPPMVGWPPTAHGQPGQPSFGAGPDAQMVAAYYHYQAIYNANAGAAAYGGQQAYNYSLPIATPSIPPFLAAAVASQSPANGQDTNGAYKGPDVESGYDGGDNYPTEDYDEEDPTIDRGQGGGGKANNILPIWGNEKTMNLNGLLLTNIQSSPYFKVTLYALKTYHEVVDEIWYNVKHLEPWERGSRKAGGQTGMCGSVRGVGAGGIVSTPFCILYKFYTLKLSKKQLVGLLRHKDSPFIRAIGFLYIRYTQPPENLWNWLEKYLEDEEEFEPSSNGGHQMTIGSMCRHLLSKLDWFGTLFPRIPVPVQKTIVANLAEYDRNLQAYEETYAEEDVKERKDEEPPERDENAKRKSGSRGKSSEKSSRNNEDRGGESRARARRSRSRDGRRSRSKSRSRDKKSSRGERRRSRSKDRTRRSTSRDRSRREHSRRSRSRDRQRSRSRDRSERKRHR